MKAYRPSARDRYSNFQIRLRFVPFKLPSKNLEQGDLVLRVRDERGNSSEHRL
jgi:hypothetical protein